MQSSAISCDRDFRIMKFGEGQDLEFPLIFMLSSHLGIFGARCSKLATGPICTHLSLMHINKKQEGKSNSSYVMKHS